MAGRRRKWLAALGLMAAVAMCASARDAQAQSFGIGARMVWVTGADSPLQESSSSSSSSTKLTGVFLRLRASKHVGLEVSYDWRTSRDAANTLEAKTTPIQVSGLFYLFKGPIAPYVLAGAGWYKTRVELVNAAQTTPSTDATISAQTTKFGYHTGLGGELMLGKHASIFVDYRYTFVNVSGLGGILGTASSLLTGGFGTLLTSMAGTGSNAVSGTTNPNVSHLGSMWTTGLTLYF